MDCQDWNSITFKKKVNTVKHKDKSLLNKSKSQNEYSQKMGKIENETLKKKKISADFKIKMQKARLSLKLSQKDLATKLNVKTQVITSYENGLCTNPSNNFISKLEKHLKCKLPRIK